MTSRHRFASTASKTLSHGTTPMQRVEAVSIHSSTLRLWQLALTPVDRLLQPASPGKAHRLREDHCQGPPPPPILRRLRTMMTMMTAEQDGDDLLGPPLGQQPGQQVVEGTTMMIARTDSQSDKIYPTVTRPALEAVASPRLAQVAACLPSDE